MNSIAFIGKRVEVLVDRPMGSAHPKFGFRYPVNYGYVPNTVSGDGEELDAYILGVNYPIANFTGQCLAVIRRKEELDDKLVIVPEGARISGRQIRQATAFQEQFFTSEILFDDE